MTIVRLNQECQQNLVIGALLIASNVILLVPVSAQDTNCDNVQSVQGLVDAINNASCNTISLGSDLNVTMSYNESRNAFPVITREVSIQGNNFEITRDANASEFRFFYVDGNNGRLSLEFLTLSNGKREAFEDNTEESYNGGAIYNNNGHVNLSNVTLIDNSAISGAAIYSNADSNTDTSVIINNSFITSNTTVSFGAIFTYASNGASSSLQVTSSVFANNRSNVDTGSSGGAIYNSTSEDDNTTATIEVTSSIFSNNYADNGGAIANHSSLYNSTSISISNSTFSSNTSKRGGAISNTTSGNIRSDEGNWDAIEISNSVFYENEASLQGGAINNESYGTLSGIVAIDNGAFYGNTSSNGTTYYSDKAVLIANNSIFIGLGDECGFDSAASSRVAEPITGTNNFANDISCGSTFSLVNATTIVSCDTVTFPVAVATVEDLREAINCANNDSTADTIVVTTNLTLSDTASTGWGFPEISSPITIMGLDSSDGMITMDRNADAPEFNFFYIGENGELALLNLELSGGRTLNGGAVYVQRHPEVIPSFTAIGVKFTNNHATNRGGAVYISGERYPAIVNLVNTEFTSNTAENTGGAISAAGLSSGYTTLTIVDSVLSQNTATNDGNALFASISGGTVTFMASDSEFIGAANQCAGDDPIFNINSSNTASDSSCGDATVQSQSEE